MDLEEFLESYIQAALWSSTDESTPEGGEPIDDNYDIDDIDEASMDRMRADCRSFIWLAESTLADCADDTRVPPTCTPTAYAGHDFWLTRCGHGCGFWDGDYPEPHAAMLTNFASLFGESNLYVADGIVYLY